MLFFPAMESLIITGTDAVLDMNLHLYLYVFCWHEPFSLCATLFLLTNNAKTECEVD